jgi:3'-phosphoadenosine 5'-phosphosulfate sulfotransferase (PAPS reductase)/FAD synthetase
MDYSTTFARHKQAALQFSGGKDSLAVLYLMRPWWDRLTVYHVDSGDAFPETRELVAKVAELVPRFRLVQGRQPEVLQTYGWPADLVPVSCTPFGRMLGSGAPALISRYDCCYNSLMLPLWEQMQADKITLIIRGQKNADALKPPLRSGDVLEGVEYLYPIEDWDEERLRAFLEASDVELPRYYQEGMTSAPDCRHCTAWLEHRMPTYVERHHPDLAPELFRRLRIVRNAIQADARALQEAF